MRRKVVKLSALGAPIVEVELGPILEDRVEAGNPFLTKRFTARKGAMSWVDLSCADPARPRPLVEVVAVSVVVRILGEE